MDSYDLESLELFGVFFSSGIENCDYNPKISPKYLNSVIKTVSQGNYLETNTKDGLPYLGTLSIFLEKGYIDEDGYNMILNKGFSARSKYVLREIEEGNIFAESVPEVTFGKELDFLVLHCFIEEKEAELATFIGNLRLSASAITGDIYDSNMDLKCKINPGQVYIELFRP